MRQLARTGSRRPARLASIAVHTVVAFFLLTSAASGSRVYAQAAGPMPDLKSIVLSANEMPGYKADPSRTTAQDRSDGSSSLDAAYTRTGGTGPTEVRLAAARTASGKASLQAMVATRDALLAGGWTQRDVPLLGDEAIGIEASGTPAGGVSNAGYGFVFRFGRHLIGAIVTGPASSTTFDHALGYAVQMSARLDAMVALAPVPDPDPAPAGTVATTAPTVAASAASTSSSASSSTSTTANAAATSSSTGTGNSRSRTEQASSSSTTASLPPSTRPSVTAAMVAMDVKLENAPDLENGFKIGGFSGLVAPDSSGTNFITTTDRGPNGEIKVDGKKELAFPLPRFTPRIVKLRLEGGTLNVVDTITLKVPDGYTDGVTKSRDLTGLPAFEGAGEDAYSPDGKQAYGTDPYGVDPESLAFDSRDGSYWLGEEYGPSIVHVAADGTLLMRITPKGLGLSLPGVAVRELLPDVFRLRKTNRGFEALAMSPDGTRLFAMVQSPLLNPDKKAGEASRHIRIAVFDTSDGDNPQLAGVYVYQAQKATDVGATEQDEIKIGDMAAISRTRILVGERDSVEGGSHKKVYLVDLAGATDILQNDEINGRTVEQATDADLKKAGIEAVKKTMVVDLAKLGFSPDKFEGLALVDATTIAVVNDNDFGVSAIDSRGRVVRGGSAPRLVVIRVPEPLQ